MQASRICNASLHVKQDVAVASHRTPPLWLFWAPPGAQVDVETSLLERWQNHYSQSRGLHYKAGSGVSEVTSVLTLQGFQCYNGGPLVTGGRSPL